MRRSSNLSLAICALAIAACSTPTYVSVRVETGDLVVPTDVRSIRISASNPDDLAGSTAAFRTQDVVLCWPGESASCISAPVTMTLTPGPKQPDARVRVQVDAFDATDALVSSDASLFSFSTGEHSELPFVLRRLCVNTQCALENRVCGPMGGCVDLVPGAATGPPDLAPSTLPAAPITRVAYANGSWSTDAMGVTSIPPPCCAQPGDRLIVYLSDPAIPVLQTSWTRIGKLGAFGVGFSAFTRVAGSDEGTNLAAYQLSLAGGFGPSTTYFLFSYRNAGAVHDTFESNHLTASVVFPSVSIARSGSVLTSVLSGLGSECDVTAFTPLNSYLYVQDRTVAAGPTGDIVVSCTVGKDQLQYLIDPL